MKKIFLLVLSLLLISFLEPASAKAHPASYHHCHHHHHHTYCHGGSFHPHKYPSRRCQFHPHSYGCS